MRGEFMQVVLTNRKGPYPRLRRTWNVQISGWVDTSKFNLLALSKHLSAVECYKEAFALEGPEDLQFILSQPYPAPHFLLLSSLLPGILASPNTFYGRHPIRPVKYKAPDLPDTRLRSRSPAHSASRLP